MRLFGSIALTLVVLALPGSASAEIWSASESWPPPAPPGPSLEPQPPTAALVAEEERQAAYLRTFGVAYDDQAGTVTLTWGYYEPGWWAERGTEGPGKFVLALGKSTEHAANWWGCISCGTESEPPAVDTIYGTVQPTGGEAFLAGYSGSIKADATFNGNEYTLVYSASPLASHNLNIAVLITNPGTNAEQQHWLLLRAPQSKLIPQQPKQPRGTVRRATKTQLRAMTTAANAQHAGGFDAKQDQLSHGKVTGNGWGTASWSIFPHGAQPESIVFHIVHGRWHVVTWGSAVCEGGQRQIPTTVCGALDL